MRQKLQRLIRLIVCSSFFLVRGCFQYKNDEQHLLSAIWHFYQCPFSAAPKVSGSWRFFSSFANANGWLSSVFQPVKTAVNELFRELRFAFLSHDVSVWLNFRMNWRNRLSGGVHKGWELNSGQCQRNTDKTFFLCGFSERSRQTCVKNLKAIGKR